MDPSPSPLPQGERGRFVFLGREALAAPEDVGGEKCKQYQEGNTDPVGAGQNGQIRTGVDKAEYRVEQVDQKPPALNPDESNTDQEMEGG